MVTKVDTKLPRVLILGGTKEARDLARVLVDRELAAPTTSLKGLTEEPKPIVGEVRTGGFGGMAGLMTEIWKEGYVAVIDATHPFARHISANAAEACEATAVPRLVLTRPEWEPAIGETWIKATDEAHAAEILPSLKLPEGAAVFLALGRLRLDPFTDMKGVWFVLRTVDPIERPFSHCTVLTGRGPFELEDEVALFEKLKVQALICRNSGGESDTKLQAARAVQAPIVMIERPLLPEGETVFSVDDAARWIAGLSV